MNSMHELGDGNSFDSNKLAIQDLKTTGAKFERDKMGNIVKVILGPHFRDVKAPLLNLFPLLTEIQIVRFANSESGFTDRGLGSINAQNNIETFVCRHNKSITDAGLNFISSWPNIKKLCLACSGVTDFGVQHLANNATIRYLDLSGNRISDKAIQHLCSIKSLRRLILLGTDVSDSGKISIESFIRERNNDTGADSPHSVH